MTAGGTPGAGVATGVGVGATLAGRYVLESLVATGGMGALFRGHDLLLERTVAVKTLHPHLAGTPDGERFQHEAQTLASLTHPNLVTVYDMGVAGGLPYLVMEFIEGESLAALIEREAPLAPAVGLPLALQLCRGMAHAHAWGVIHRDIKPQNILITPDRQVRIVDFGIARGPGATEITAPGWVLGTAHYLAPEVAAGQPATVQTDLYSLGVVLYRMFTGRLPFEGSDPLAVAMLHRTQPPPRPSSLRPGFPAALEAVLLRLLDKEPARRFPSAAALATALSGGTVAAPPPPPLADPPTQPLPKIMPAASAVTPLPRAAAVTPRRTHGRARLWHWLLLLLVALLAAGFMWFWLRMAAGAPSGPLTQAQAGNPTPNAAAGRTTPAPAPPAPPGRASGMLAALVQEVNEVTRAGRAGGELDQLFRRTDDMAKRAVQGKAKDVAEKAGEVRDKLGDLVKRGELPRATADRLDAQVRALIDALALEGGWRGNGDNND